MSAARETGADMAVRFGSIPRDELPAAIEMLRAAEISYHNLLARKLLRSTVAIAEAILARAELVGVIADFDEVAADLTGSKEDRLAANTVASAEWLLAEIWRMDNEDEDE